MKSLTEWDRWKLIAENSLPFGAFKVTHNGAGLILNIGTGRTLHPNNMLSPFQTRKLIHKAVGFLRPQRVLIEDVDFSQVKNISRKFVLMSLLEANHVFDKYKSQKLPILQLAESQKRGKATALLDELAESDKTVINSINLTKRLVEEPSNHLTPKHLADFAIQMAKTTNGLRCEVLDQVTCKKIGLNAFLSVAQASTNEPYLIELNYVPRQHKPPHIGLIGKGLCYDTGGLCLKPNNYMYGMKSDMAGAATVLGIMKAIAELKLPIQVTALVLACENSFGGAAFRPGDIIKTYSGKTVEVVDTDAEGRLTLADALSYLSERREIKTIIDYATLTGSCAVSFGEKASGAFTNSPKLLKQFAEAAEQVGEPIWELPLWEDFKEDLKSPVADLLQCDGRPDASIAATFLKEFLSGEQEWLHLDIAGTAYLDEKDEYLGQGATGRGVWSSIEFLQRL